MFLNAKNKIKLVPFTLEINWQELMDNYLASELSIIEDKSYLATFIFNEVDVFSKEIKTKEKNIWLNGKLYLPFLDDKKEYQEKLVSELIEDENIEKYSFLKYKNELQSTPIKIKKNMIINELFKDYYFENITLKSLKIIENENFLKVDKLITKVFLIDDIMIISPKK